MRLIGRGIAAFFIFLLTYIIAFCIIALAWSYELENRGYETIVWGPDPAPEWLGDVAFGTTIGVPVLAVALAAWGFWRWRKNR